MRMMRYNRGVTNRDKIRNERIRGTYRVIEIFKKVLQGMLQWHRNFMRREGDYIGRRDRPRRRWRDCIEILCSRHCREANILTEVNGNLLKQAT